MLDSLPTVTPPPTPTNDLQYIVYAIAFAVVAVLLGSKFIDAKYRQTSSDKKDSNDDSTSKSKGGSAGSGIESLLDQATRQAGQIPGVAHSCKAHDHRMDEFQVQLENAVNDLNKTVRHLQGDINNNALETEKAFHKFFKEMMTELKSEMDRRDARMQELMDQKLALFKMEFSRQAESTFRPMVEDAVAKAIRKHTSEQVNESPRF